MVAPLSRFVCDMNRDPDDVSRWLSPSTPAPECRRARLRLDGHHRGTPALARPLTLAEWQARRAVHAAYHGAIREALTAAQARFGFAVLVDGHSMPSVGRTGHKDHGTPARRRRAG